MFIFQILQYILTIFNASNKLLMFILEIIYYYINDIFKKQVLTISFLFFNISTALTTECSAEPCCSRSKQNEKRSKSMSLWNYFLKLILDMFMIV